MRKLLQRPAIARPEQPLCPLQVAGDWIGPVELTVIQQCSDTSQKVYYIHVKK